MAVTKHGHDDVGRWLALIRLQGGGVIRSDFLPVAGAPIAYDKQSFTPTCLVGRVPREEIAGAAIRPGDRAMRKWKSPKVIEIAVGMEINCYACATA